MAEEKVKKAYFYRLYALANGKRQILQGFDWAERLQPLTGGDVAQLTVEDWVYQPAILDDVPVVGVHAPIKTDFLSTVGDTNVRDVLSDEVDLAKRFAHSTAVAFTGVGNVVVLARGDGHAPHHTSLKPFLTKFLPLGEGVHWAVEPILDSSKVGEFIAASGAVQFETQFTTAKDLFDGEAAAGPVSYAERMANHINANLDVKLTVSLSQGIGTGESRTKLKGLLQGDLGSLLRNPKSRTKARVLKDGVLTDLTLVESNLHREFEVAASQTETGLFSDLLRGVAAVGAQEEDHLEHLIGG